MNQRYLGSRDHDHRAETALIDYIEDPTAEKAQAAELAVARLQRAYDHVLRRLESARDGFDDAHHWQRELHALEVRHTEQVAELREELSAARSWAWAAAHRLWAYAWFPPEWAPQDAADGWHLPAWLSSPRQPHQQDWWRPPRAVIHTDLGDLTEDSGVIELPPESAIARGDVIYLTDDATYLLVEVGAVEDQRAHVQVRWRGDRD